MIFQATGCVCKLTLGNGFSALNGIYYIALEMTFKDAVASKVDFLQNLYTPAGKTNVDYEADYNSYLDDIVLVCNPITDKDTAIYIPSSLLSGPPDPTVKAFYRRMAVIDLGIVDDPNTLLPLITQVGQMATAVTGITNSVAMVSDRNNTVYKTADEYAAYLADMAAQKSTLTNPYIVNQQLASENLDLRARLQAAEEQLIQYLATKDTPTQ